MVELGGQISPDIQLRLNNPLPVDAAARPVRRRRSRVALGGGQPNVNIDNVGNSRDGADLFDDLFSEEDSAENTNLNADSTPIVDAVDLAPNIEATPVPAQQGILKTVQFMVVSALGAHEKVVTSRDGLGREVTHTIKSKDVYTIEQNDFAQRRLQEAKEVWDPSSIEGLNGFQRFGKTLERTLSRVWRGMGAEDAHLKKEMAQGIELSKIAGIDTAVTEEFFSVIENKAKARIKTERNSKSKQLWGKVKDAWAEFSATNGDLHKYELAEARELRRKYDANPANPDPVENPLYALVNRDVSAREALASRLNESDIDIIKQTNAKDKKTAVAIRLEGEKGLKVQEYLKKEILEKIIDDYTTRLDAHENVTGISAKLRRESDIKLQNYFMTAEFQDWVKTLPAEQQAMFENSFTYASDLLLQTEEGLLPAVKENLAHYKSADKLNFDMELSLGTAQLSANTESVKDGWFSKERKSLNQKLMDQMRGERNTTPTSHLYDTQVIHNGVVKDRMMGYVSSIVKNEALAAWFGALTVKGSMTLARKGLAWAPGVGAAALAGTASGLKEWARMGKHRETFGFGKANGLEFPVAANAVKSAELNSADYHRIQISDRTQQLLESANKFKEGTADVNTAFMTMVYDADSTARLKLNGERNINLMTATVNGPEGRGIFARELRSHDHARSVARVRLNEYLADEGRRNEIATLMGIPDGQPRDTAALMDRLVNLQYNNLLSGVKVDAALAAAISSKDSHVILEESQSIRARDKIFNGLRIKSTAKYAATSSVIAGVAGWGLGRVFNHTEQIAGSHETYSATLVDHSLPSVTDHIPTSTITDDHGNMVVQTFSHVPAGTHLVETQLRVGGPDDVTTAYNLVADNATDKVLLHNISFGDHGQILNQADLQQEMLTNHITLSPQNLHPVGWEVSSSTPTETTSNLIGETKDLRVGDLPGFDKGWSGWFHNTMSADGVSPRNPELNAVVKTFRAFEIWEKADGSNVINEDPNRVVHFKDLASEIFGNHKDVVSAAQSDTAVFKDIPSLWSTAAGHEAIAKTFTEAESTFNATKTFADEAHRIIYEAGIGGEKGVPDANEIKVLLEYFGHLSGEPGPATEAVTTTINPVEYWFNMSEDVVLPVPVPPGDVFTQTVPDMWTHLAAAGYSHPLEAPSLDMGIPRRENATPYYGTGSLESMRRWLAEHPESKKPRSKMVVNGQEIWVDAEGKEVTRSVDKERELLSKYIESVKVNDPEYYKELEQLVNNPTMKQMSDENRVSINIPAYMEEKNLHNLLTEYVNQVDKNGQPLATNLYEINILINRKRGVAPDASVSEINRFITEQQALGKSFNINYLDVEFDPPYNNVGNARKVITDLTLMRSLKRNNQAKALYIESEDADLIKVDSRTVINAITALDASPYLDAVRGIQDRMPEVMQNNDYLFSKRRLWDFTELAMRRRKYRIENNPKWSHFWNRVITGGWNTAYSAEAYALIGGYDRLQGAGGEDVAIGEKISMARGDGNKPNLDVVGKTSSRSDSSPRRFIHEIITGRGAYADFANELDDARIRNSTLDELMASIEPISRINATSQHHFIDLLQGHYGVVKELTPNIQEADMLFKELMSWMGLQNGDYSIVNGELKVTNLDNLKNALESYRARHTGTRKIGERVRYSNIATPPAPTNP